MTKRRNASKSKIEEESPKSAIKTRSQSQKESSQSLSKSTKPVSEKTSDDEESDLLTMIRRRSSSRLNVIISSDEDSDPDRSDSDYESDSANDTVPSVIPCGFEYPYLKRNDIISLHDFEAFSYLCSETRMLRIEELQQTQQKLPVKPVVKNKPIRAKRSQVDTESLSVMDTVIKSIHAPVPSNIVKEPIKSKRLTYEEQTQFLKLSLNRSKRQKKLFNDLLLRVQSVQQIYCKELKEYCNATKIRYLRADQSLMTIIDSALQQQFELSKSLYPGCYEEYRKLDLPRDKEAPVPCPLLSDPQTVLRIGQVLHLEVLPENCDVPTHLPCFADSKMTLSHQWQKHARPPVSRDPFVQGLLTVSQVPIQVVVSSSVLVTLAEASTIGYSGSFDLPLTLQQLGNQKVLLMDKKLPNVVKNLRTKQQYYYDKALSSLCKIVTTDPIIPKPDSVIGTDSSLEQAQQSWIKDLERQKDNLTYTVWKFDGLNLLVRCKYFGCIQQGEESKRLMSMKSKVSYAAEFKNQWESSRNLSLELPCIVEHATPVECARWWMHSFIRPGSSMLVSHVDVFSRRVKLTECKQLQEMITGCAPWTPKDIYDPNIFQPEITFRFIEALLKQLLDVEQGSYLLRCCQGQFTLLRATEQGTVGLDPPSKSVEKAPIVPPAWFPESEHHRIPFTFPPSKPVVVNPSNLGRKKNKDETMPKKRGKKKMPIDRDNMAVDETIPDYGTDMDTN